MDKKDYLNKINDILTDREKFRYVEGDESSADENIINRCLVKLKKEKKITAQEYDQLIASISSIPVLYCIVKVHKKNFSIKTDCINV
jgi:hypothetical protein